VTASHELEEHVGEVAVALRASSLAELFAEAGRALAGLLLGTLPPPDGPALFVEVHAPDPAALLVDWLNELIYLMDVHHAVFTGLAIERIDDHVVVARVRGVTEPQLRGEVKAATLHAARVLVTDNHVEAHVVLDV
jgi:SHS2 domain-containing protein